MSKRMSGSSSRQTIPTVSGKVKQGGNVIAMLKLLPVIKPAFKMFPVVLEEMGYGDLVIRKK